MTTYKYHCSVCFKTYIGPQLPATMTCNCQPPRQIIGVVRDKIIEDFDYDIDTKKMT